MTHLVFKVVDYFKNIARNIQREQEIRKTIRELNQLSDQELRDIGISRGMIHSIAMESYYDNRDIETNKNLRGWV